NTGRRIASFLAMTASAAVSFVIFPVCQIRLVTFLQRRSRGVPANDGKHKKSRIYFAVTIFICSFAAK
ncbi:MAG: hypothetical protein LBT42_02265, partial [Tannerella sp.]|nr:hypothetical protein [Tannerella sp.]